MAKSFIKWAGGKAQLIPEIMNIVDCMRSTMDSFVYVEPFVGGGSLLFYVLENCSNLKFAVINDMNSDLMNCYKVIKSDEYLELKDYLIQLEDRYNSLESDEDRIKMYYDIRNEFNERRGSASTKAGDFIFLNKCGFNGLYRVNKKGEFNVPWGQKKLINLYDGNDMDRFHILMEKVVVLCGDYKDTRSAIEYASVAGSNIIYYMDPPYRPVSKTSSFVGYTADGFDDDSQKELKCFCDEIVSRGGNTIISNSKSEDFFETLYSEYTVNIVKARRNINSDGAGRGETEEVLIYNGTIDCNKEIQLF